MDISDPSHGRVSRERFRSVDVVKGVRSLLTDLLFHRQFCDVLNCRHVKYVHYISEDSTAIGL